MTIKEAHLLFKNILFKYGYDLAFLFKEPGTNDFEYACANKNKFDASLIRKGKVIGDRPIYRVDFQVFASDPRLFTRIRAEFASIPEIRIVRRAASNSYTMLVYADVDSKALDMLLTIRGISL